MDSRQGLYDPNYEHDACGVGFVVDIKNRKSHEIVRQGLLILANLNHRGAVGADKLAADGAGILIQVPDELMRAESARLGISLPEAGHYGVGMVFLPQDNTVRGKIEILVERYIDAEGLPFLGWRDVPVDSSILGASVAVSEPVVRQLLVARHHGCKDQDAFERKLFVVRKIISNQVAKQFADSGKSFYIPSFSSRTINYKGMLLADQVDSYFRDLSDERLKSALALVHQRFSTNTFPTWSLAHPFRMIAHNGEINTLRGNLNWMAARRDAIHSHLLGDDLQRLWPMIPEGQSDSACFDNALELLVQGGYSLAHAMMLLIPEAWRGNPMMDEKRRAFYEYHAALMEPWDGPAAVCFTDGRQIGATLDRNGLRPARYLVTDDDKVVMASEMGVLPIPEEKIIKKWRLQPGKMLLIDLEQHRIIGDEEIKEQLASAYPYQDWLHRNQVILEDLPDPESVPTNDPDTLLDRQQAFGYSQEDVKFQMIPLAVSGQEAIGSMGMDVPIPVLSSRNKSLSAYFKQCFAQVTNPPIDSIREEAVMSLVSMIGSRPNLLGHPDDNRRKRLEVRQPVLTNENLEKIRGISRLSDNAFRSETLDITWPASEGTAGMKTAIEALLRETDHLVRSEKVDVLILSDRKVGPDRIPVPALLAVAAVHHYLVREGKRTDVGLVLETGEAKEIHDFCVLIGYGAEAINPYLVFETLASVQPLLTEEVSAGELSKRFIKGVGKAILKITAKMGISTLQSYCGAQIFDAVGLASGFVDQYFTGTASRVEGVGLAEIAEETVRRHRYAYGSSKILRDHLDVGGEYANRVRGEEHIWNFDTISALQHAVRGNSRDRYIEYSRLINEQDERLTTLRGLFIINPAGPPVPLDEVQSAAEIVKFFSTGAMSFGSISFEAHSNMAIAMNRIGGKSNSGEGGEDAVRFKKLPNGDSMRSSIKQVASGRFGVTAEYLVNADDIQIKMAQGAKPGEGGQLPGHKVNDVIARVRHSTPGVGLISPPPHHDIYSIEDLAQLIFDLKNVNSLARISVKLVSEIGVGTVAAGVAKARADHITISGYDGGTGASPLTSIKHAGSPWEIGLAETHQTLVRNRLRGRVSVQVDGGVRTGRDVVIGALLGADEFGFSTAPLIASGCVMMRKCHLNTCPVGVATQDPDLRKKFSGKPEHVINYFFFVAEEVRELMASMGVRNLSELTGRSDLLDARSAVNHWKAKGLNFEKIFYKPDPCGTAIRHCEAQEHGLEDVLDRRLIELAEPALNHGKAVQATLPINNTNRTVGAMLSGEVARRYGHAGLSHDLVTFHFTGTAGQSFGAFLARGITMDLSGQANDYVGKGLSGGRIIVRQPQDTKLLASENIIVGNTLLYGATDGELYANGVAGERFAVRNSGAVAVVEGVGDHGCEYMTGGIVVVIGQTGRNFAAGMSGGIAYVLDEDGNFERRCNLSMVELEELVEDEGEDAGCDWSVVELEGHGANNVTPSDMTMSDSKKLRILIQKHLHYTNSQFARHILANWSNFLPKFVKVMPVDYRQALQAMQQCQQRDSLASGGLNHG